MKSRNVAYIKFIASGIILALAGFIVFSGEKPVSTFAYSLVGAMIFLAGYVFYQGVVALKNQKAGLKPVDEFSKKISEKAASKAFVFSVYMWLFTELFVIDWLPIDGVAATKITVASGMMVMALIFIGARIYYSRVGINDENKN